MSYVLSNKQKHGYILVVGIYTVKDLPNKLLLDSEFLPREIAAGRARRLINGLHIHINADVICIGALYRGSMRLFISRKPNSAIVAAAEQEPLQTARLCIGAYIIQHPGRKMDFVKELWNIQAPLLMHQLHLKLVRQRIHLEIFPHITTILNS